MQNVSQEVTKTIKLTNKYGLHARPAAMFVETSNKFKSVIKVSSGGNEANGKNILDIMTLGAQPDTDITLNIVGDDAESAAIALTELVESKFGEE